MSLTIDEKIIARSLGLYPHKATVEEIHAKLDAESRQKMKTDKQLAIYYEIVAKAMLPF